MDGLDQTCHQVGQPWEKNGHLWQGSMQNQEKIQFTQNQAGADPRMPRGGEGGWFPGTGEETK